MSFSGVVLIFLVILATGIARYEHRYKQKLYPINLDLINDWSQSELSSLVPKNKARYIKHSMDRLLHGNSQTLEDTEHLEMAVRTLQAWEEMKRKAHLRNALKELRRKWNARPMVEFGPGSYKPEVSNYNPEDLGEDLKRILALKKKQEDQEKDLNN